MTNHKLFHHKLIENHSLNICYHSTRFVLEADDCWDWLDRLLLNNECCPEEAADIGNDDGDTSESAKNGSRLRRVSLSGDPDNVTLVVTR